ncbi:protein kinase [Streptomyces sp. NPDC051665]|uniref:serine/threonine-protein kinase n=1 Tax=Streptomyces sp. NPDC051665 TaxID=3154647 RepID=UPI00342F62F1
MRPEDPTDPLRNRLEGPADSLRTRLEPDSPFATAPADALRTRLESEPVPQTPPLREEEAQQRETLTVLPKQLAARFQLLEELPAAGAEANLLLVADQSSRQLVAKIYRRAGRQASREVWAKIPRLNHRYVVQILETGEAGQRDYELMEYVSGGNLARFVGQRTDATDAMVTETVRQIASALSALHEVGIIHQDLKPENVLVRSTDPLDLALTDFGVSRVLDQTRAAATAAGTLAYLAPELLLSSGGQTSRARDWWALGMMARELLLGQRPFEDMGQPAIDAAVMLRDIDLDGVTDPRLRMLCAGLLTRDPEDRWGAPQVTSWLAGGSPAVAVPVALPAPPTRTKPIQPLVLLSVRYTEPSDLAAALTRPGVWEAAARRFFTDMGPAHQPSEGWRTLRKWLRQFDEPDTYDIEALQELVDHELHDPALGPDARLIRLLRVLNPRTPPQCRGLTIDRENLLAIARRAAAAQRLDDENVRLVEALWQQQLLTELAQYQGAAELRDIDASWRAAESRSREILAWLWPQLPATAQQGLSAGADAGPAIAPLLSLLLGTEVDTARLVGQLDQVSARTATTVPWFAMARHQAGGDPAALATVRKLVPAALVEAEQTDRRNAAAQAAHQERIVRWQHMEAQRVSPGAVAAATRSAVGPLTGYGAAMVFLAVLGGWVFDLVAPAVACLVIGLICLVVQFWLEIGFAQQVGAEYGRGYTLFSQAGAGFLRAGRPRGAGFGCLLILAAPCVLSALVGLPALAYVPLVLLHLRSVSHRRELWTNQYAAAHTRVVNGQ